MSTVADMMARFQGVRVSEVARDTLFEIREEIADVQREQMQASELSTGGPILPLYSASYAKRKGFSEPNLLLYGDFQADIKVDIEEPNITFGSTDDPAKVTKLVNQYTDDIFGLNEKRMDQVRDVAEPALINNFRKELDL